MGQCSAGFVSPPIQVAIEQSCQNRGTFPLLVQAVGGQDAGYATLGYLYSNGNTLPADGGVAHVSPTGTWSTGNGSQDIVVTNAPTSVGNGATTFSQIANGVPDYFSDYATGDGTYTFAWQPGYPTSLQSESVVSVSSNDYSNLAVSSIATRTPPPAGLDASTTLDLSTLLPLIDSATVDSSQPGRPSVAWTSEAGSLASADGAIAILGWTSYGDAGRTITESWTIVGPPTVTSMQAPILPASLGGSAPAPDASFAVPAVIVVEGTFLSGYAELRAQFASIPATNNLLIGEGYRSIAPPLPADGTLRMTTFTTNGD